MRLLYGAKPVVSRGPVGLKVRDLFCWFMGHRPSRRDSRGVSRCLRCLTPLG